MSNNINPACITSQLGSPGVNPNDLNTENSSLVPENKKCEEVVLKIIQQIDSTESASSSNYEWNMTPIEKLSPELLMTIFHFIEPQHHLSLVCKYWNESFIGLKIWETKFHLQSLLQELDGFRKEIIDHSILVSHFDDCINKINIELECNETAMNIHNLCMRSSHASYLQERLADELFAKLSQDDLEIIESLISKISFTSPFLDGLFQLVKAELPIYYANLIILKSSDNNIPVIRLYQDGVRKLCSCDHSERAINFIWNSKDSKTRILLLPCLNEKRLNPKQISCILHLIIERVLFNPEDDAPLYYDEYSIPKFLYKLHNAGMFSEKHLEAILTLCKKMKSPFYSLNLIEMLIQNKSPIPLCSQLTSSQIDIAIELIQRGLKEGANYALALQAICSAPLSSNQINTVLSLISNLRMQLSQYKCLSTLGCICLNKQSLNDQQTRYFFNIIQRLEPIYINNLYNNLKDADVDAELLDLFFY